MIGIIDYGMGNLKSICNALEILSIDYIISKDKEELKRCEKLILPGVGAFNDAMSNLKFYSLDKFIKEEIKKGKFILGICLGMQLLFSKSYEGKEEEGLNILKGEIISLDKEKVRVPHIGWNSIEINKEDEVIKNITKQTYMYYVHSFYASDYDEEDLVLWSNYNGVKIPGLVRRGNIIGAQFHPEKSSKDGLMILKNFSLL